MPRIPKWIGDTMELAFKSQIHPVKVSEIELLDEKLKRIRFTSERLKQLQWLPGQEIEFRVSDQDYRHYTPCNWNIEEGYTDVIFYLHGQGPGSDWAEKRQPGDQLKMIGPGGKFTLIPAARQYVFLGDETTIGLFLAMQQAIGSDAVITGVIESEPFAMKWPAMCGLTLAVCERISDFRGKAIWQWVSQHVVWDEHTVFYISGHAGSIQLLKKELLAKGIHHAQVKTKPYWATGKKGL